MEAGFSSELLKKNNKQTKKAILIKQQHIKLTGSGVVKSKIVQSQPLN